MVGPILIDIETCPAGAVPGLDLTAGPPGWGGPTDRPVERRKLPANLRDVDKIAAWEAAEDTRHALAVATDADTQRTEAWEHWRGGSLRWADVRIGCIGWTTDAHPEVIDAIAIAEGIRAEGACADAEYHAEKAAILRLFDLIPRSGPVWTWGRYDARVIRARCLAHGLKPGPLAGIGKPWERRLCDLQAAYAAWLHGHERDIQGISVREVAAFVGVPGLVGHGSEVTDLLLAGRWEDVVRHCRADVQVEWELLRVLSELGGVE